ncbi:MAG TPA: squalene synthase HpnD [Planctomycetes bacterium]|nr:squalene synthase HpnD [Planctomycetota bacterium]
MTDTDLTGALEFTARLVKREARNFYWGFMLLPPGKRRAVYALYAFCRLLDDAVDAEDDARPPPGAIRGRFERIARGAGADSEADRMVSLALADAMQRYPISPRHLEWIIDGVLMDLAVARYASFGDLQRYLFGVASAVGLACIEVFGHARPEARAYAIALGYAMQLTNIIRDVKEDFRRGRVYLPGEDMARFAVQETALGADNTGIELRRLLAFEAGRARRYFEYADGLWPLLAADAVACPRALALIYGALLGAMERGGFAVLDRRFRLPAWRKLLLMLRARLAGPGRLAPARGVCDNSGNEKGLLRE